MASDERPFSHPLGFPLVWEVSAWHQTSLKGPGRLYCVLGSDPAPAGEAWLVHGMVRLLAPRETVLSHLLPCGVGNRQVWVACGVGTILPSPFPDFQPPHAG